MYQFHVERPWAWRAWVCPRCETGGSSPRPLLCWWCGRPAIEVGTAREVMSGPIITRIVRRYS